MEEAMIVVTGAIGKTGSKIVSNLLSQAKKVRCIASTPEKLQQFTGSGAEASVGSLDDISFLTKAFSDAAAVYTVIPPDYSVRDFRAYQNKVGSSISEMSGQEDNQRESRRLLCGRISRDYFIRNHWRFV